MFYKSLSYFGSMFQDFWLKLKIANIKLNMIVCMNHRSWENLK